MREDWQGLPADGRQSETALMIARGVRRLLRARGFSSLTELPLTDGRRADIAAVNRDGEVLIVEVKSSPADFRADRKWRDYVACCDRLYFAISERTPAGLMPLEAGLIVADSYGAEIVREAELQRMAPASRRALLLRFAQAAADRLHRLADPGAAPEFRGFAAGWSRFCSLSSAVRGVGRNPFGFPWLVASSPRRPPLTSVGLSLISLDSLVRIYSFQWVAWLEAGTIFLARERRRNGSPRSWHEEGQDCSWASLT